MRPLDTLFRQQLTDLLATRILAEHTGMPTTLQPVRGAFSPVLRRAIERLRSDSDADVSLAALASDAGLSRFHFCRAFKESAGLSPHAWLRQYRLEQAMDTLRDTDVTIVGGREAWLRLADCLRRGVRNRPAKPRAIGDTRSVATIALQYRNRSGASAHPVR